MNPPNWFARPILIVSNVEASLRFYIDRLGFISPWRYNEDGRPRVAEVDRQGTALILADNIDPGKIGQGVIFISLNVEPATHEAAFAAVDQHEDGRPRVAEVDRQGAALILADNIDAGKIGQGVIFISLNVEPPTYEAAFAAVDQLRAEFIAKGVAVKDGTWGYRLLVVEDPDGNQLLFNYPADSTKPATENGLQTTDNR